MILMEVKTEIKIVKRDMNVKTISKYSFLFLIGEKYEIVVRFGYN